MLLFVDIETTGLPVSFSSPIKDFDNWPRIISIAWLLSDFDGEEIECKEYILKIDDFDIPVSAMNKHHITKDFANTQGMDRITVLKEFAIVLSKAKYLLAHNVEFEKKVIHFELMRKKIKSNIHSISRRCTMLDTIEFCKAGKNKWGDYKYPSFKFLYEKLFNEEYYNTHIALDDVIATRNCFFELVNRGQYILTDIGTIEFTSSIKRKRVDDIPMISKTSSIALPPYEYQSELLEYTYPVREENNIPPPEFVIRDTPHVEHSDYTGAVILLLIVFVVLILYFSCS